MQKQLVQWDQRKTRWLIFFLIALYALLFLPFWKPVVLGYLFAAACEPMVNKIRRRMHAKRTRVAYATVSLGLAFFIGLIAVLILQGYSQIYELFRNPEAMAGFNSKVAMARDQFLDWANQQQFLSKVNVKAQLDRAVVGGSNTAKNLVLAGAQGFLAQAPAILLELFIFIAAFGAFLVIQPRIWRSTAEAFGLGEKGREHFQRFEKICGLALGSVLITGLVQSILVTIGAAIAGFDSLLIIFGATLVLAMIPVLGAGSMPVVLMLIGLVQGNMRIVIVSIITAVVVGVSDNILRAWMFSRAAKSNPVLSLISLLGGLALFGFSGLFIAPVIEQLVMTYAFSEEGEPQPHQVTAEDTSKARAERLVAREPHPTT